MIDQVDHIFGKGAGLAHGSCQRTGAHTGTKFQIQPFFARAGRARGHGGKAFIQGMPAPQVIAGILAEFVQGIGR